MLISAEAIKGAEINDLIFSYQYWTEKLPELAPAYQSNCPFPHICLSPFLNPNLASEIHAEFCSLSADDWIHYQHYNEDTLGNNVRTTFPPKIGKVFDELNSSRFTSWLSSLTGIPGLVADPALDGAGMHRAGPGGFLNLHTDFTHHHYRPDLRRRCNVIVYLNDEWKEEWGGAIQFWNRELTDCMARYWPLLNHAVIFNTDENSYHGYPDPISPPRGVERKSLAVYYYTIEKDWKSRHRSTNYRARPGDGAKSALIWMDKLLLAVYSRAKERFGLSDKLASYLLKAWKRRK
jgi:Rps23 Pro-64 3,4-dihydroxylase Tpa1-like proline 4-hydroxylase